MRAEGPPAPLLTGDESAAFRFFFPPCSASTFSSKTSKRCFPTPATIIFPFRFHARHWLWIRLGLKAAVGQTKKENNSSYLNHTAAEPLLCPLACPTAKPAGDLREERQSCTVRRAAPLPARPPPSPSPPFPRHNLHCHNLQPALPDCLSA